LARNGTEPQPGWPGPFEINSPQAARPPPPTPDTAATLSAIPLNQGLWPTELPARTFALAAEIGALTHGHPSGYLSGEMAVCIWVWRSWTISGFAGTRARVVVVAVVAVSGGFAA
jgi:hypothetical protein